MEQEQINLLVTMAKEYRLMQYYHGFMFITKDLDELQAIMFLLAEHEAIVRYTLSSPTDAGYHLIMASYGSDLYDDDVSKIIIGMLE